MHYHNGESFVTTWSQIVRYYIKEVLVSEIWIAFTERIGIPDFRRTTLLWTTTEAHLAYVIISPPCDENAPSPSRSALQYRQGCHDALGRLGHWGLWGIVIQKTGLLIRMANAKISVNMPIFFMIGGYLALSTFEKSFWFDSLLPQKTPCGSTGKWCSIRNA